MKKLIYMLLAAFISANSFSQTRIEKIFKKENYHEVIKDLKEKEKTNSLTLNECELLALSYYYNNDYSSAYVYFEKIMSNRLFKRNSFPYSHCLKAMGNIELSDKYLKEYYNDNKINNDLYFEDIEALNRLGNRFEVNNLKKANTEYSDIFSQEYDGLMYFSSTRPNKLEADKYKWNNQPYMDIFMLKKDSTISSVNTFNTDYHDGDLNMNKLNGNYYFTSSRPDPNVFLKKDQVITTKIYKAIIDNGVLKELLLLPFNSNDYSCKSPFIDYENNKLYFSSNKPGGIGGFDIYYVDINDPIVMVNLGSEINTINDEDNYYVDSNNNIYFSSNGYVGLGGKDIFTKIFDKNKNQYKRVMNVGLPVNSKYDDFGYRNIDNIGFFTSNRKPGAGDDDIYTFKVTKDLDLDKIIQTVDVFVKDSEMKAPLKMASVTLKNKINNETVILTTDETGRVSFNLEGLTDYEIETTLKMFKKNQIDFTTSDKKYELIQKNIFLESAECLQKYYGKIANNKTNAPLAATINLYDTSNNLVKSVKADANGDYIIMVPCSKLFELRVNLNESEDPFYAEYREYIETDSTYDKEHNKNIYLLPVDSRGLISDKFGNILIPTKPIYFAYNSANVESVSFSELDKVSNLLKEHITWKLIINSHSDMRGSDKYNLLLSNKRAEATKAYLVSSGIDKTRISFKGFGESKPLIDCVTKECSEEEHGINRRSDFIIK